MNLFKLCLWISTARVFDASPASTAAKMSTGMLWIHVLPQADGRLQEMCWVHEGVDTVHSVSEARCSQSQMTWGSSGRYFLVGSKHCQIKEQVLIKELTPMVWATGVSVLVIVVTIMVSCHSWKKRLHQSRLFWPQDSWLRAYYVTMLTYCCFQMVILTNLHTVQHLGNVCLFLYALQTGGVPDPAFVLHGAFTGL